MTPGMGAPDAYAKAANLIRARSHNDSSAIRYVHPALATSRISANAQRAAVAHTAEVFECAKLPGRNTPM